MDQIGKMYQNRAMVLQEQVNRLEHLLELRMNRQETRQWQRDSGVDDTPKTNAERDAMQPVGGGSMVPGSDQPNPGLGADSILNNITNGLVNSPYWTAAGLAGAIGAYKARSIWSPNRVSTNPNSAGRWYSAYDMGKVVAGQPDGPPTLATPRWGNMVDHASFKRAQRENKLQVDAVQAKADAAAAKAQTAAQAKADADRIKTNDFTRQYVGQQPDTSREPREQIVDPVTGKPVVDPVTGQPVLELKGRLKPEAIDAIVERQRIRHTGTPHEKVTPESLADMESGQMRQQAVSDPRLSPEVPAAPNRSGGNAAATAVDLAPMTGREVAGKLAQDAYGIGSKGFRVFGAATDPASEASSTILSRLLQGAGRIVSGGVGLLPAVIDLTASNAHAPTIMPSPEEQAEIMAAIKRYEEDERKRNEDNTALEKFATNPSGNFTPDPETQYERDWRDELFGTRDTVGRAIDVESRRMAARRGDRASRWGEKEQDFLQSRQQQ